MILSFVKTIGPFKRVDQTLLLTVISGAVIHITLFYTTFLVLIPGFSEHIRAGRFILLLALLLLILTTGETIIDRAFFVYCYSDHKESLFSQLIMNFIFNIIEMSFTLVTDSQRTG